MSIEAKTLRAGSVVVLDVWGAVERKPRPMVVLSSETYHRERPDVVVGFLTRRISAATAPTDCVLEDWQAAGLNSPSAFRAYITTRPRWEIRSVIGALSDRDWAAVKQCLRRALEVE